MLEIWKNHSLTDMDGEEWKPIDGYDGAYMVSNLGRFKSIAGKKRKWKIKHQYIDHGGYLEIYLYKNNIKRNHKAHREVGVHWVDNPNSLKEINHKKGIKTDNRATELEWSTRVDNMLHAYATGLRISSRSMLGKFGRDHNRSKPIRQLDMSGNTLKIFGGSKEAAREMNTSSTSIYRALKKITESCCGFKWEYMNVNH